MDEKFLMLLSYIWAMTLQVIRRDTDSHEAEFCGAAACAHSFQ